MSKYLDLHDKKTATIFADGAGAVVLQARRSSRFPRRKTHADGSFHDHMGIYAGGTHLPITKQVIDEECVTKVRFAKKYPAEVNTEGWPAIVQQVLAKARLELNDIKLFLFTQVNLSTIKEVMNTLNLPMDRTHDHAEVGLHRFSVHTDGAARCRLSRQVGAWRQRDHVCFGWWPQYGLRRFRKW